MTRERRYALEAGLAAAFTAVVRRLPRRLVLVLGRGLGRLWGTLDRRHLRIAADNLRLSFPDWDEERVLRTARGVYAHFGTVLFDILWMDGRSREELLAITDVEGLVEARAAVASGRGVVCPTGHYGNWEFQGVASALLVGPFSVVARPLDNPQLDRRLVGFRTSTGNTVIYKKKALSQIMQTIREGGVVAIVIDQNVQEKDGIFVDFFGRPACTTTVAAALALKTGCIILPVRCPLGPDGRYRMIYGPPVEWEGTGRGPEEVAALTQRLTSIIEGWVREHPEQWLWLHRRWKTQPSSAPPPPPPGGENPAPTGPGGGKP
ncbi:MAG: lysophospholipid acyltransferase family protein [Acidobacteria bacterium]|nr:lysophospholipid acyltransferase family protein [Acidobacteriota bacterium]